MANGVMNNIFLSASIPDPTRNVKYFDSADFIAIRDAVRALATVVIPKSRLVWGGHPAITPLIRFVVSNIMKVNIQEHVTLYQTEFFRKQFPSDNVFFEKVIITKEMEDKDSSLLEMRSRMFNENQFKAAVFIGGMDGIEQEYKLFKEAHPTALILPVGSTGAAAKILYDKLSSTVDKRLLNDYAYMHLFRSLLKDII